MEKFTKQAYLKKKYDITQYSHIKNILGLFLSCYKSRKSWSYNWNTLYRETKTLKKNYDVEEKEEWEEEDFCLFFPR